MKPRMLAKGSYLQLFKMLNVPGLPVSNKIIATYGDTTSVGGAVKYIVEVDGGFYVLLQVTDHKGWKLIQRQEVHFVHDMRPPDDVTKMIGDYEAEVAKAKAEAMKRAEKEAAAAELAAAEAALKEAEEQMRAATGVKAETKTETQPATA